MDYKPYATQVIKIQAFKQLKVLSILKTLLQTIFKGE